MKVDGLTVPKAVFQLLCLLDTLLIAVRIAKR